MHIFLGCLVCISNSSIIRKQMELLSWYLAILTEWWMWAIEKSLSYSTMLLDVFLLLLWNWHTAWRPLSMVLLCFVLPSSWTLPIVIHSLLHIHLSLFLTFFPVLRPSTVLTYISELWDCHRKKRLVWLEHTNQTFHILMLLSPTFLSTWCIISLSRTKGKLLSDWYVW